MGHDTANDPDGASEYPDKTTGTNCSCVSYPNDSKNLPVLYKDCYEKTGSGSTGEKVPENTANNKHSCDPLTPSEMFNESLGHKVETVSPCLS